MDYAREHNEKIELWFALGEWRCRMDNMGMMRGAPHEERYRDTANRHAKLLGCNNFEEAHDRYNRMTRCRRPEPRVICHECGSREVESFTSGRTGEVGLGCRACNAHWSMPTDELVEANESEARAHDR